MKTKRKFLIYGCILLTGIFIMATALCLSFGLPQKNVNQVVYAAGQDGTGDGTENNPYLIGSANTLNNSTIRSSFGTANKHFKLIDNIDLQSISWAPIVSFAAGCVFDGNGKEINNLRSSSCGLFSTVNGGTFKDLTLNNINITGGSSVGGIGGIVKGTVICTNVYVNGGSIANTSSRTGGFFGQVTGAIDLTIDKCCVESLTMTGTGNSTGGFIGLYESGSGVNNKITITNSYHIGNITGKANIVAGIFGGVSSGINCVVTIEKCFHIGDLRTTSGYLVGGIFGYTNSSTTTINIIDCFSSGTLNSTTQPDKTGGIYGGYDSAATRVYITNSYYDKTKYPGGIYGSAVTANIYVDSRSSGKTTAQMKEQSFVELLGDAYVFNLNDFPKLKVFGNTKTVTFNYNYNGAPTADLVTKLSESEITDLDISEPLRIGYLFTGWNTEPDGSGTTYNYDNGVLIDNIDNLDGQTLYAQWSIVSYTLSVDIDGAGSVSSLSSTSITLETKNISITATPDEGGNFAYWQIRNNENTGWVTLNDYTQTTLNFNDILDENFISLYAQSGNRLSFRAVFADTHTLTIKSDQQSFGSVTLNGDPIDYNTPANIVQDATVVLSASAKAHYRFAGFNYTIDSTEQTNESFIITQDTVVYVTFEREEYTLLSSSKYSSGEPTADDTLISLSNKKDKPFRIGDEMQISYKTNETGYRFLSLNLIDQDGLYYNLNVNNSGIYYLEITDDILDNYLMLNPEIVALYVEQYKFSINFNNERINDYCNLGVYTESAAGKDYFKLGTVYYLDKDTEITINISFDEIGYKNLSANDVFSLAELNLVNGADYKLNFNSDMSIAIGLEAVTFKVTVDAIDHEGNPILEISFSEGKEFLIEYQSDINSIEKTDIATYRFIGWKIYNHEAGDFVPLDSKYIDANTKNLSVIDFNYLSTKYIFEGDIKIIAEYYPVATLTSKIIGSGSYKISVGGVVTNTLSGQFDLGEEVKIEVVKSDYIEFKGFVLDGEAKNIAETNGKYILTFNLSADSTVSLEFAPIEQTINITEKLNKANGTMEYKTTGNIDNKTIKANINDTIMFTFALNSGYQLKEWKINNLTIEAMKEQGYATYSGNVLMLELNEKTLAWLSDNEMKLDVSVTSIFNPLFTALIVGGSLLILGLMIFITLYMLALKRKKKTIEAAVQAGVIGSARFRSNLVENALNAEATKTNDIDDNI